MTGLLSPVWLNDRLADPNAISIAANDRGLTLGDGLFETLPVFGGGPVFLNAHVTRMIKGAAVLGIPLDRAKLEAVIANLLAAHGSIHGILRITVTHGAGGRGLAGAAEKPTLLVTLAPWTKGTLFAPVRLITAKTRRNEHSPASRLKTLSYIDNILAAREAAAIGADDALMLSSAGRVACTTISNVAVLSGPSLTTPALSEGVLPGIVRGMLGAEEALIHLGDLFAADAVFLTNSVRLVRPVISLDGRRLSQSGMDRLRDIFDMLCAKVATDCGADPRAVDTL